MIGTYYIGKLRNSVGTVTHRVYYWSKTCHTTNIDSLNIHHQV